MRPSELVDETFNQKLPLLADAFLLPFNDKIIYDGILGIGHIHFGSGISKSINSDYMKAKSLFGIITYLPFNPKNTELGDSEMLKFYMKSEHNRDRYSEEIDDLVNKDLDLRVLYHQEMGKIDARYYRKRLKNIGLTGGWFALLGRLIVASGKTKDDVDGVLDSIVPARIRSNVYLFKLK